MGQACVGQFHHALPTAYVAELEAARGAEGLGVAAYDYRTTAAQRIARNSKGLSAARRIEA